MTLIEIELRERKENEIFGEISLQWNCELLKNCEKWRRNKRINYDDPHITHNLYYYIPFEFHVFHVD